MSKDDNGRNNPWWYLFGSIGSKYSHYHSNGTKKESIGLKFISAWFRKPPPRRGGQRRN